VIVKRPDGVDTMSYVLSRQAQTLSLRIVNPLQDDAVGHETLCDRKPIGQQSDDSKSRRVAFGKVVNFGVYQTTFTAEQHLEFDMF
jgi:hypothetical protein